MVRAASGAGKLSMEPYYSEKGITIYHGDCREILPTLEPMDIILTDIPYSSSTHDGARSGERGDTQTINFAAVSDTEAAALANLFVEASRRWVIMSCDWRHSKAIEQTGFLKRFGIWVKENPMAQMSGDRPAQGWEALLFLHRTGRLRWNGGGKPAVYFNGTSRWGYFGPSYNPTQKPLGLLRQILTDFAEPQDVIGDPCCGSGSTLRAAKDRGLRAIGIDLRESECEIAAKRLSQEVLNFEAVNS